MYKIPVIFDVDTGLDDAMTLAMACATPEIDVRAVTCTFGNHDLHHTLRNTLNMLKLLGREDIPVAAGADEPLLRKRGAADEVEQGGKVVHGVDGLGGFRFPFPDATAALSEKNAVDLTYQVLMESEEPVVYCALGAHGNPGRLLQKYPEVKSKIKCFVNMGGYIRNGTLSPMSSVNIFYDPHGAAIMLESGIPYGDFFRQAPSPHPNREKVTGSVCGVRVESIGDPLMREIRILDKLVDELAKGKPMEKVLRK